MRSVLQKHFSQYTKRLIPVARMLRRGMTNAERKLWSHLRDNQLGVKFRRQFPIEKHVLDFYCHQVRLDVEVDGAQHYTDEGIREDEKRDAELEQIGIKVLRYSNHDVLTETDDVIDEIFGEVQSRIENRRGADKV